MQIGLPFQEAPPAPMPPSGVAGDAVVPAPGTAGPAHGTSIVFVRHRRARRYVIRVDPAGTVRVTIPRGGSRREAEAFAVRQAPWIARQRARASRPGLPDDVQRALRARARVELPLRLFALAREHGLEVAKVSIRNQRTRWGSCGHNGHISLNWRLLAMPDWVCEYVLVHELMHLRRLDHSPQYWTLVAAACPRYEDARRWLRTNGRMLR